MIRLGRSYLSQATNIETHKHLQGQSCGTPASEVDTKDLVEGKGEVDTYDPCLNDAGEIETKLEQPTPPKTPTKGNKNKSNKKPRVPKHAKKLEEPEGDPENSSDSSPSEGESDSPDPDPGGDPSSDSSSESEDATDPSSDRASDTTESTESEESSTDEDSEGTDSEERDPPSRRRKKNKRKKRKKKKKKHPKHRRKSRKKAMTEFDALLAAPEGTVPGDEYYYEEKYQPYTNRRDYNPYDLKGINAPPLKDADEEARIIFRIKYLEYVRKHQAKQRKLPPQDRVLPASVVEYIRPALLTYICKHILKKYKKRPLENVPAISIHRWALSRGRKKMSNEEDQGIKEIKQVKIDLNGAHCVRNVQRAFVKVSEIQENIEWKLKKERSLKSSRIMCFHSRHEPPCKIS